MSEWVSKSFLAEGISRFFVYSALIDFWLVSLWLWFYGLLFSICSVLLGLTLCSHGALIYSLLIFQGLPVQMVFSSEGVRERVSECKWVRHRVNERVHKNCRINMLKIKVWLFIWTNVQLALAFPQQNLTPSAAIQIRYQSPNEYQQGCSRTYLVIVVTSSGWSHDYCSVQRTSIDTLRWHPRRVCHPRQRDETAWFFKSQLRLGHTSIAAVCHICKWPSLVVKGPRAEQEVVAGIQAIDYLLDLCNDGKNEISSKIIMTLVPSHYESYTQLWQYSMLHKCQP